MKTLHPAYRVTDLASSLSFYTALGYRELGRVELGDGARLTGAQTSWLTDPDGYRIELVQWPPGHADGISAADFR